MIQHIEHVRPKLESNGFGDSGVFDYPEVDVLDAVGPHRVSADIPYVAEQ